MENNEKVRKTLFVGDYSLDDVQILPKRLSNEIQVSLNAPTNPLVYIMENNLDKTFCKEIIEKFDNDIRKEKGRIFNNKINLNIKNTLDLNISRLPDWHAIDKKLFYVLLENIKKYEKVLEKHNYVIPETLVSQGFQIQKYNKGVGEYKWHTDDYIANLELPDRSIHKMSRFITFIWYLNDVEVGGETKFLDGVVKPKTGQFLFFPATWDQLHRGGIPESDKKYIITGWLYNDVK
jgi:hypothetical protein